MRRAAALAPALSIVLVTVILGPAWADAGRPAWLRAQPPAGWERLDSLSRNVATSLEQLQLFGELPVAAGAEAFAQPGVGAFYLSWLVADAAAPSPGQAIRLALDGVRHGREQSSPQAGSTEELSWDERVEGDRVAEALHHWRHLSNETTTVTRVFGWASTAGAPRLVRAECVLSAGEAEAEKACRAALAAVRIEVPPAEAAALGPLPASAAAGQEPGGLALPGGEAAGAAGAAGPAGSIGPAPAGDQKVLYQGPPPEARRDPLGRWLVLGGGALVVLALVLTYRVRRRSEADPDRPAGGADPDDRAGDEEGSA